MIELLIKQTDLRYTERFASQDKATALSLSSAKEAVLKAEAATEKRLEGLNELRGIVNDILNKTMSRVEAELAMKLLQDKIEVSVQSFQDKLLAAIANWDARHQELVDRAISLEKRQDVIAGERVVSKEVSDNSRANIAIIISVIIGVGAIVLPLISAYIKK